MAAWSRSRPSSRDVSIGVFTFVTRAFSRNNRADAVVLGAILGVGFLLASGGTVTAGAVTTAALSGGPLELAGISHTYGRRHARPV